MKTIFKIVIGTGFITVLIVSFIVLIQFLDTWSAAVLEALK